MINYSVRLYGPAWTLLRLARVVSVEAGQVANDVADAQLECLAVAGLNLDDVQAFGVTRHEAGQATPIGVYVCQGAGVKVDSRKTTWRLKGSSPLCLYQQRLGPNVTAALNQAAALTIHQVMNSAFRHGDTPLTVEPVRGDTASPRATTSTGVLEPLSLARDMARAAETLYGTDLRRKVNYAASCLPTTTGMTLRPVVWVGEHGEDRRVGSGVMPVLLYLSRLANGWEATSDRSKQVTRIIGTGEADTYTTPTSFENPVGNRREKTASASSGAAGRTNAQSRATLYEGRSVTRLQAELNVPPSRFGLALGDVFSVNVGGTPGTARLNVVHWAWGSGGEQVASRLDVELE